MTDTFDDLNTILTRLLELALDLGRYQKAAWEVLVPQPGVTENEGFEVARAGLAGVARRLTAEAVAREAYFPDCGSHDAAWAILLELYIRASEQKQVTVSDACVASRAPPTTALRWIGELVQRGSVVRRRDTVDRRRAYLSLSEEAFVAMSRYLAEITGITTARVAAWAPRAGEDGCSHEGKIPSA